MRRDACFFFFSSRRRHTRSLRDWSSDVCSSDLGRPATFEAGTNELMVSRDGGATWVRAAIPAEAKIRTSYLTRDGAHILVGEGQTYWISRDQGAHYETFTGVSGLPSDADGQVRWSPGGYVLQDATPDSSRGLTFYRSADGLTWKRITIG